MSLLAIIALDVPVTEWHLAAGIPGNCRLCALALAVADAIEGATGARVYYDGPDARADVTLAGGATLVLGLGPDVTRIMAAIDRREPVAPFTFVAEVRDQITEGEAA